MASRRPRDGRSRAGRRLPSRTQVVWSALSLLVLLGLIVSTCAIPATP